MSLGGGEGGEIINSTESKRLPEPGFIVEICTSISVGGKSLACRDKATSWARLLDVSSLLPLWVSLRERVVTCPVGRENNFPDHVSKAPDGVPLLVALAHPVLWVGRLSIPG